jgi:hypothetical protein
MAWHPDSGRYLPVYRSHSQQGDVTGSIAIDGYLNSPYPSAGIEPRSQSRTLSCSLVQLSVRTFASSRPFVRSQVRARDSNPRVTLPNAAV